MALVRFARKWNLYNRTLTQMEGWWADKWIMELLYLVYMENSKDVMLAFYKQMQKRGVILKADCNFMCGEGD
jgi:hypothetical protein